MEHKTYEIKTDAMFGNVKKEEMTPEEKKYHQSMKKANRKIRKEYEIKSGDKMNQEILTTIETEENCHIDKDSMMYTHGDLDGDYGWMPVNEDMIMCGKTYTHIHTGTVQTGYDWIRAYDNEELDQRDMTAGQAFRADINVTLCEL